MSFHPDLNFCPTMPATSLVRGYYPHLLPKSPSPNLAREWCPEIVCVNLIDKSCLLIPIVIIHQKFHPQVLNVSPVLSSYV